MAQSFANGHERSDDIRNGAASGMSSLRALGNKTCRMNAAGDLVNADVVIAVVGGDNVGG